MAWLTVKEFAEQYRTHPKSVYRLVRQGRLEHVRIGKKILLRGEEDDKGQIARPGEDRP